MPKIKEMAQEYENKQFVVHNYWLKDRQKKVVKEMSYKGMTKGKSILKFLHRSWMSLGVIGLTAENKTSLFYDPRRHRKFVQKSSNL